MGYKSNFDKVNKVFDKISSEYRIFAPKRFPMQGRYSDTDIIRYTEVYDVNEIEFNEKSDYAAKEVVSPINQTLFYFNGDDVTESKIDDRKILIFARPCDINSFYSQDQIYLKNGFHKDPYYARLREKVKFAVIECTKGWDTCFCVTMNANKTEDYSLAIRALDGELLIKVKDEEFEGLFADMPKCDFALGYIKENQAKVNLPEIPSVEVLNKLKEHSMWDEYTSRCIGCGSCTVACSTCTCFTTIDIIYDENNNIGERRRVNASCQVVGFDTMAGGHNFRTTAGQTYRYKLLHKVYNFKKSFGFDMCVGCGRCTSRCPVGISFTAAINKTSNAVKEMVGGK